MEENRSLMVLNIDDILPNRFQPRIKFDEAALTQLAESISKFGIIEPIVVRPIGNKYEIIAGERRYKASKLASKSTIPAIIIKLTDKDSEELALLENVQRQSLNPIEEAVSYKRILDMGYISREELSKKIGKPQTEIFNKIKLLTLDDEVQSYLLNNKISERHARSLLKITNLNKQTEMLHRIVNERLTVKQTDKEIKKMLSKEEEIESLFDDDERGQTNMDIEKIMREAKDINQEPEQIQNTPDLMVKPEEPQPVENVQVPLEQPQTENVPLENENPFSNGDEANNKFVNVQPNTFDSKPEEKPQPINQVTFDSIFKSPAKVAEQPEVTNEINTMDMGNQNLQSPANNQVEIPNEPSTVNLDNQNLQNPINSQVEIPNEPSAENLDNQNAINPENNQLKSVELTPLKEPQKDISTIVADAFKKVQDEEDQSKVQATSNQEEVVQKNIPDVEILNDNVQTANLNINDQTKVVPQQLQTAPSNFSKIVKMLRDCANQIEQSGYSVDVDEVSLDDQYKVVFTINK